MPKRVFDVIVSICALIMLSPILLVLAATIAIVDGRPIFYKGWRAGLYGRPFSMFKLRTMVRDADRIGGSETPSNDPRITRIGRILRRYKLDELPQFYNVLVGEMSIVGPRPEVLAEVDLYGSWKGEILSAKPGITDWASIKFRHEGEMLRGASDPHEVYRKEIQPEKIRLGLKYAREKCFLVDVSIILRTVIAVFAD